MQGLSVLVKEFELVWDIWEDYLHEVLPNQIETYLARPRAPRNVSHSTAGIVISAVVLKRGSQLIFRGARALSPDDMESFDR